MRRLWPALVAAVAVVVVLSLLLSGVLTPTHGSTGNPATPTFATASAAAASAASSTAGGPWSLVASLGLDTTLSVTENVSGVAESGCTFASVGTGPPPTQVYLPAYSGSFSAGASPFWGMIYVERSTQQMLLIGVLNGTALPVGVASGSCVQTYSNLTDVPPAVVDSSAAASTAWSNGGSAFVAAHSSSTLSQEMIVIGGGKFSGITLGASWVIEYTTCPLNGTGAPSGSQPEFQALIDAESGALETAFTTSTSCH